MTSEELEKLSLNANRMEHWAGGMVQEEQKATYTEAIALAKAKEALEALQEVHKREMLIIRMAEEILAGYDITIWEKK